MGRVPCGHPAQSRSEANADMVFRRARSPRLSTGASGTPATVNESGLLASKIGGNVHRHLDSDERLTWEAGLVLRFWAHEYPEAAAAAIATAV